MTLVRRRNDEGSLPLAMLVVVVGVGLSMLTATTVTRETIDTQYASGRVSALLAARTGLASALAALRAARDTANVGVDARLPCVTGQQAQVTGVLSGRDGSYAATVWYLTEDPAQHDEAWVRERGVRCPAQLLTTAQYAYVSSVGTSTGGRYQRTLTGTYQFKLRAKGNMPGGQIRVYRTPAATQDHCLSAPTPSRGMPLTMQVCATNADGTVVDRQKFGYMSDLTIKLMTADPVANPSGLCAQAGAVQAVGQEIVLRDCGRPTLPYQQWSFDSNSNFRGTTDGRNLNNFCWNVMSDRRIQLNDTAGKLSGVGRRCGLTTTDYQSWNVTADAGSGAAGPESGQLVNFRQFGKCLDFNYSAGYNWAFPCKQSPSLEYRDMSQVWNEVWTLPEAGRTGLVYVVDMSGAKRCMRVPGLTGRAPVQACPAAGTVPPADFTWLVRGDKAATYDEKYRIEGTGTWAGRCLAPLPGANAAVQADWVGMVACSGDYLQKWNAVPPVSTSGLVRVNER